MPPSPRDNQTLLLRNPLYPLPVGSKPPPLRIAGICPRDWLFPKPQPRITESPNPLTGVEGALLQRLRAQGRHWFGLPGQTECGCGVWALGKERMRVSSSVCTPQGPGSTAHPRPCRAWAASPSCPRFLAPEAQRDSDVGMEMFSR